MKKRGIDRKAQITVFLIAATIILLLGIFYFVYQSQVADEFEEKVPQEIVPIKAYVENCVKSAAEDGLETIGLTGGYINLPEKIRNDPRTYLSTLPASGYKIPYWWYNGIEAAPPEDFIKQQLRSHVKTQLRVCLNNFEPFKDSFEINALKEPVVDVFFNEDDTTVKLKYQLEIIEKNTNSKINVENFIYKSQIRFKKVYELAKLMMDMENKNYFLEQRTIDLYSMDTEIPTTDVDVSCEGKVWQLSDIKEKLRNLLRVNLPYIRIKDTDYNPNIYVPNPNGKDIYSQTYFQSHYVWEITKDSKRYKDMKVAFTYDDWPLTLYARPVQNGLLKSNAQKGTEMLKFFCLQIWHFTYDIKYPVLVTIFEQDAAKNKRYQFNFAFIVDVDHNQPNRVNKGTTLFETLDEASSEEYCNNLQNQITIFTVDNATGEDLQNVNLTFVCGRFYCDMGKSDWLSLGAASGIVKRFPFCFNGVIKGAKESYQDAQAFIQTDADRSYILFMEPIKEFSNYKVVKHSISDPSVAQELSKDEKASIFISSNETGFESFVTYPKDLDLPLKLPAGKDITYDVTIYLVNKEEMIGGYSGAWKPAKDDIKGAKEIVFHAIAQEPTATEDDKVLLIAGLDSYSKNVPAPEVK